MKKLFLIPIAAIAFLFTSCLENEIVATSLGEVTAPVIVDPYEGAIITASVMRFTHDITSVVIEWSIDGNAQEPVNMTVVGEPVFGEGFRTYTYVGTIPGQGSRVVASWRIAATNANGNTDRSTSRNLTWIFADIIAAWNYPHGATEAGTSFSANSGTLMAGTNLQFFYANTDGAATIGRPSHAAINVPNSGSGGWFIRTGLPNDATAPSEPITPQNAAGWYITFSTTGYEELSFSAGQASSGTGPGEFRLAYRIGTTGTWTDVGAETVTSEFTPLTGDMRVAPTFVNVPLPATINNRPVVQLKVFISGTGTRSGDPLPANNGNTSINEIVFIGIPIE